MSKKKHKESYVITFKGLLSLAIGMDTELTDKVLDALELYMRRNIITGPNECGAIIFTGKEWVMTSVERGEE